MPRRPARDRAVAALVLAASLSACGSGSSSEGALGDDTGFVTLCTPASGESVVFADEIVRNESARPLTIDEVRLVAPDGLTLDDAFLLPIRDRTLLGTFTPPASSSVWQERRQALGAEVAAGETWNLALVLHRDEPTAGFADVEVDVVAGGDLSTHRLRYSLTVVATPSCPPSESQP